MNVMIEFAPIIPLPLLWAAIGLAVVISGLILWQNRRGALLRVLALTCLCLALANPNLRQEERQTLSSIAIVVVDETASQAIAGRTERAKELRAKLEKELKNVPNLEVRWITSANKSEDGKEGTTLFTDLNRGLSGVPADRLAGVFMITDGQIHDVPVSAEDLSPGTPIHALLTGEKQEFDRRIEIIKAPRFGLVDSNNKVKFRIVEEGAQGQKSGGPAKITITREGLPDEERIVNIGDAEEFDIFFPHAGQNISEIELEGTDGELTFANNRAVIAAEGVRENLRVLLVSGEPHAGERTWRNLLKSDAAVDLVHFTILRPPEKQDGTPIHQLSLIAFPTRELFSEKLDEFDLIIFDRYQRRNVLPILYLDNIARYVENGGAVLVAAGESFSSPASLYRTPLSQVLPAAPTGQVLQRPYRAAITDEGLKHPVTAGLPGGGDLKHPTWGRWFRLVEAKANNGEILMKGPEDKPLLILDRLGKGRVALLLSDHAWLWARGYDGGGPYADLLRRTAHWLMKEPDLEEEALNAKGHGKSLTIERRSMKDEVEDVELSGPGGKKSTVKLDKTAPGLWRKTIKTEEPGLYRMKSSDLNAVAHIGPINSREVAKVAATDGPLSKVLETSGGGAFWMGKKAGEGSKALPRISMLSSARIMHGSGWMGLRDRDAHLVRGVKLMPLFTGLIALAALLGLVSITWFREGR